MPLTDAAIRSAKPTDKPLRLFDGGGLYLEIAPGGGKWWRYKYRFGGKEKRLSLGVYPEVPLASRKRKETGEWIEGARDKREACRRLLAEGVDPAEARKVAKACNADRAAGSFEATAREWYAKYAPSWVPSHGERTLRRLERDVFPWIGARPVGEVTAPELLDVVRRIEGRGALETAHRALANCGQVFRYAVATGRAERDPSRDLRGALPPVKGTHFAAVTDPARLGELLRAIDGYNGSFTVRCALRLAPLVFVRPGELRAAEWADIDLDAAEWRYTATKTGTPHIVPLARQAVEVLRELQPLTGRGRFLFPSARTPRRPMSDNAILGALRRMGVGKDEMSGHGFRATARTILDEVLGVRPDYIEHQLAHAVRDPNGRAYNRTAHLPERRRMMQQWADYLDKLRAGAEIIPLRGTAA
ncbi:MAG: integrase arm-type DNA-binding domain-containing protein [Candidatus Methylomirabilis sp.]|nr:integrase arm-type DNA-binding domain-containing protein [Deltaproteobacteria bacterium]